MSTSKTSQKGTEPSPPSGIIGLVEAWQSGREPFAGWVNRVSEAFFSTQLGLEDASRWIQVNPVELAAVLRLATLDEGDLNQLSEDIPPKTTWFAFSRADSEAIRVGLEALEERETGESAHRVVQEAIADSMGPGPIERVAELPTETLVHFADKADKYDELWEAGRKALRDIAKQKERRDLTEPQKVYLHDLVEGLVDAKVITRESPDGDQELCNQALDAIGE